MDNVDPKSKETIDERKEADKEAVLIALKKAPFVFLAIKSANRDKSTFYRWIKEDKEFAKNVVAAKKEGIKNLHERAFSVLAKHGTDSENWRAALELIRYLDRLKESKRENLPPALLTISSDPTSLSVLSDILKLASENSVKKEAERK